MKVEATLRELTVDELRILMMIEEEEEEDQALNDTLEMIHEDFKDKVGSYGRIILQAKADADLLKAQADVLKGEVDRIMKRVKMYESRADRLKDAVMQAMITTGDTKIKTPEFTFGIRSTQSVAIDAASGWDIPQALCKEPVPDKTKIKEFLKNIGECDFAHMETKQSLIIR